jgi:DNA-binding PadR family transcriptional regulator
VPVQHTVLSLLVERESYGYELRAEFERTVGPQWGELNIGYVYQVLDRLVRDGLVTRRGVQQPRPRDRVVYRITDAGRAELDRWLASASVRQSGYRDDFFLKLAAASRLGRAQLEVVLRTQRAAYLSELAALSALRTEHADEPLVELLIGAAIRHTEANLAALEQAEERADALTRTVRAATYEERDVGEAAR